MKIKNKLPIVTSLITSLFISCSKSMDRKGSYNSDADFIKKNYAQIDLSDETLAFKLLDPYLKQNIVYLTGESHGTDVNYKLELKFLKYFKSKAGVKYYLLEYPVSNAVLLNKYLETGDESILKKLFEPSKGTRS